MLSNVLTFQSACLSMQVSETTLDPDTFSSRVAARNGDKFLHIVLWPDIIGTEGIFRVLDLMSSRPFVCL